MLHHQIVQVRKSQIFLLIPSFLQIDVNLEFDFYLKVKNILQSPQIGFDSGHMLVFAAKGLIQSMFLKCKLLLI